MIIGGRECVHGYDVSVWQDPASVGGAGGHEFAVVKATEGDNYRDPNFWRHVAVAVDAGRLVGAYHFARPSWGAAGPYRDGQLEAQLFLGAIDDRIRFGVLDLEATALEADRTAEFVCGWLDEIIASGRFPIREQRVTYVGKYFNWVHTQRAVDSVLWIPWYTAGFQSDPDPRYIDLPGWSADLWPEGWALWQYTSSGTVARAHPVDCNVATRQWLDAVRGDVRSPEPFPPPEVEHMPRPVYRFPDGIDHPDAGAKLIDLRNGAFPKADGTLGYGPHWYITSNDTEIFELAVQGEILVTADPQFFAAGNDNLDRLFEAHPHVHASP